MQIKDNSSETVNEKDYNNLIQIANQSIGDLKLNGNTGLLVFPTTWQQGIEKRGKYPQICGLYPKGGKYNLSTGNVMGFVGVTNEKGETTELNITSRFYNGTGDLFLHYMLAKVFNINVVNLDLQKGSSNYYDFLPYLFPYLLNDALAQGLYKQYKRNQYNDTNVKGSIDVNRHIRRNIPFTGKIAYNTREHSYDNNVTQLVRHTIETLRTRPFGHTVLNSSDDTRQNVAKITFATGSFKKSDLQKIIRANQQPLNHPYFTKYKDLQSLCLQILKNEYTAFGEENDKIHGILFDGAWLWEEYLNTILKKDFKHPDNIKQTDGYNLFENFQPIYPDFMSNDETIVGDAKYVPLDHQDVYPENSEKATSIYYKTITYMYRFNSTKGFLVYPAKTKIDPVVYTIKDTAGILSKVGMKVPQNIEDFSQFQKLMEKEEENLIEYLEKCWKPS